LHLDWELCFEEKGGLFSSGAFFSSVLCPIRGKERKEAKKSPLSPLSFSFPKRCEIYAQICGVENKIFEARLRKEIETENCWSLPEFTAFDSTCGALQEFIGPKVARLISSRVPMPCGPPGRHAPSCSLYFKANIPCIAQDE